jgi:hypothetical protein
MGENHNHRNNGRDKRRKSKPTEEQLRDRLTKDINRLVDENEKLSEQKDNLVQLMDFNHQATQFHLSKVKETTGTIEQEDVDYCVRLSKRIINHYLNKNK